MDAFQQQFGDDPRLAAVKDKLTAGVGAVVDPDKGQQFTVLIVIAIIGLIIQIMTYCRSKESDETIRGYIKNAKSLPLRKLWRLRREIRKEAVKSGAFSRGRADMAYGATLDVGETLTDSEIDALFAAASK